MRKQYKTPELDVEKLQVEDIITASGAAPTSSSSQAEPTSSSSSAAKEYNFNPEGYGLDSGTQWYSD